ncbi:MAG TPA: hypothetical protein VG711_08480, partial [Phycisphaerales bacterium]|nr:hypothetical protein [Phycisphaerales bacterium]
KSEHNPNFHVLYTPPEKIKTPASLKVSYSIPSVEFESGWGIFTGGYPVGQTRRVRAVGIGTSFVLQVQTNQDLFINLASSTHNVQVDALLGRMDSALFQPGQYTFVDDSGRITVSDLSSAPADVQKIASDAEDAIAGM